MSIIGVVSMKGGVGKTTITANLSAALAEQLGVGRVSVVDLDPQNAVRLHLGIDDDGAAGISAYTDEADHWAHVSQDCSYGVRCLPYGEANESERMAFEELLSTSPHWVGDRIRDAGLDEDAVVLIDTPPGPSVYLKQVFDCADLVLIVLLADAASYATVSAMESWVGELPEQYPNTPRLYLLNQVDRSDLLNKDVADILQQRLAERIVPIEIHLDESVREALAFQQPVLAYNAHGQASHDLAHIAEYLIDTLNR